MVFPNVSIYRQIFIDPNVTGGNNLFFSTGINQVVCQAYLNASPGDEGTNNWGIVNPKMLPDAPWTDSKDDSTQYQKLHEMLGKLNACAQLNFGTSVWNGQPYSCTNP
jgi:hypothetical protein